MLQAQMGSQGPNGGINTVSVLEDYKLDQIFEDLRSKNEIVRSKAARDLRRNFVLASHRLSNESTTSLFGDINKKIFSLTNSPTSTDKLGGIAVISSMITLLRDSSPSSSAAIVPSSSSSTSAPLSSRDSTFSTTLNNDDFSINQLSAAFADANSTLMSRYSTYVDQCIPCSDIVVMKAAADAIGNMVIPNGASNSQVRDNYFKRAYEWLTTDRSDLRRHAAVLILTALTKNNPSAMKQSVKLIFPHIKIGLRDNKVSIREDSALCLRQCLMILFSGDKIDSEQDKWFNMLYDEATNVFVNHLVIPNGDAAELNNNPAENIHGSLLVFRELILTGTKLLRPRYDETYKYVASVKEHKNVEVRREVSMLFPKLARYDRNKFDSSYSHFVSLYFTSQLKINKDRNFIYVSIGDLAVALRGRVNSFLDSNIFFESIKDALNSKSLKVRKELIPSAFYCLAELALSLTSALTKRINNYNLLNPILNSPITDNMLSLLKVFNDNLPSLKPQINARLINIISMCLSGYEFKHPGSPDFKRLMDPNLAFEYRRHRMLGKDGSISYIYNKWPEYCDVSKMAGLPKSNVYDDADVTVILQALKALRVFKFEGYVLTEFVRYCVVTYFSHENPEVRLKAALVVSDIYLRGDICSFTAAYSTKAVTEVLGKLLSVCIVDPVPEIRLEVLKSLGNKFDSTLSEPNNVRQLFMILNDENFEIRKVALKLIGRLTDLNPAYTSPSLRNFLSQLLTTLEYSSDKQEQPTILLSLLIASTGDLTKPYTKPIMSVLVPKAENSNPTVSSAAMTAIGELAVVIGEDMMQYVGTLMPIFIDTFQDQSAGYKRFAALKALGQIASSSGYVIDPLAEYPKLLPILLSNLKSEQPLEYKLEVVRLLGFLGAIDPYKYKVAESNMENSDITQTNPPSIEVDLLIKGRSPKNEDYFPTVVVHHLQKIAEDSSLSTHHPLVIQSIMHLYKTMGSKCFQFLDQVLSLFISVIHSCPSSMLESYFSQLSDLIRIIKLNVRPLIPRIFTLIKEYFSFPNLQVTLVGLIEKVSKSMEAEFRPYVQDVITMFLNVLELDNNANGSMRVLKALVVFGLHLEPYIHMVIPQLVRLFEYSPDEVANASIICVGKLARFIDLSDYASLIVHPLLRILGGSDSDDFKLNAINTICLLMVQMNVKFKVFIPSISSVLSTNKLQFGLFEKLADQLMNGEPLPTDLAIDKDEISASSAPDVEPAPRKLPVEAKYLREAWSCNGVSQKEGWKDWFRRLNIELIRQSPSPALRACYQIANSYQPLARELFSCAFASCWYELHSSYQGELAENINRALVICLKQYPELGQGLLNLIEYMEHDDKPLPIRTHELGKLSAHYHVYAKALHYMEHEFLQERSAKTIEDLITTNTQLQQADAAVGLLKFVQQNHEFKLKENWFEKLERWDDALDSYDEKLREEPDNSDYAVGKMKCLNALGEWQALSELAKEKWSSPTFSKKREMAHLAAAAAWGLGQWERMDNYINAMVDTAPDKAFFTALLCVHKRNFGEASKQITKARKGLLDELIGLMGESYTRAYNVSVRVQMISELEECMNYMLMPEGSEKRQQMKRTWTKRLLGCQKNIEVWNRFLNVKKLVIEPTESPEDMEIWIKSANLSRKSGRLGLADKALNSLLEKSTTGQSTKASPQVVYAQLKFMWACGQKNEALTHLITFTSKLSNDLGINENDAINQPLPTESPDATPMTEKFTKLLARCYLKRGEWRMATLNNKWTEAEAPDILGSFLLATHFDSSWYKAWHKWALANYDALSAEAKKLPNYIEDNSVVEEDNIDRDEVKNHVIPAVKGFFHSIALADGNPLHDTLRLLTLWLKFGGIERVAEAVQQGFKMMKLDNWLNVVPQLISRIYQPDPIVSEMLLSLLFDLGRTNPQALVFPLNVAVKTNNVARQKAAMSVIEKMRLHFPELVADGDLASTELIRVSMLWYEGWYNYLDEASKFFFGDKKYDKMLNLLPYHEQIEAGAQTLREASFIASFGNDLKEAYRSLLKYQHSRDLNYLNQAWQSYQPIFFKLKRILPTIHVLELHHVSPKLLNAKDLKIAVFGTYEPGKKVVTIAKFDPTLALIASKQRPRKMRLTGSDGKVYQFLLKGNEDIRQDNLVMQLFDLVNTSLLSDPECFKRHLDIQKYGATPLSPKAGLLSWVPNADTFHLLIKSFRDARGIVTDVEYRIMFQMCAEYDDLTLLQKVEVFVYSLDITKGQDFYKVIWYQSKSSEAWLDRRTTYTRSLAVMSMVGYVLGLGDRHPSNLMMDRTTGKVVHIDFGDCFEAATVRDRYPETVPFRLTRMLTYAMEVSGIEGSYRMTSENVMRVLRENKESLMAIFEAFAYDPLITWGFNIRKEDSDEKPLPNTNYEKLLRDGQITEEQAAEIKSQIKAEETAFRAKYVLQRITRKLSGNDFKFYPDLDVNTQVDKLICEATSVENLCQLYLGWCAFW